MAQPQGLNIPELRNLTGLPAFTRAWAGNGRDKGWPASGIQIYATENVSLICCENWYIDASCPASFIGFSYRRFHYCPQGPWDDWVRLAKKILEVDNVVQQYRDAAHITRI